MSVTKLGRIVGAAGVLTFVPLVMAIAQTQSPPPSPQSPPAATKPETSAPPATPQATAPSTTTAEKKAAAPPAAGNLAGLNAKSSDGHSLGTVQAVMDSGGKARIVLKVGGFLGFGGHFVEIPDGKFNRVGDTVQVSMTADEVNKLPEIKSQK